MFIKFTSMAAYVTCSYCGNKTMRPGGSCDTCGADS